MRTTHAQTILELARRKSYFGLEDAAAVGTPRVELTRLVRNGKLLRVSRGLYRNPHSPPSEYDDLIEASHQYGRSVLCLQSALRLHGLARPAERLWLAVSQDKKGFRACKPGVEIIKMPVELFSSNIETHLLDGFPIRTYGLARTLIDCFKYRQLIGSGVALEGLKRAWLSKLVTLEELHHFATLSQVSGVLQPYLDALIWLRPTSTECKE